MSDGRWPKNAMASNSTKRAIRSRNVATAAGGAIPVLCSGGAVSQNSAFAIAANRKPDPLSLTSISWKPPSGGRWKSQALKKQTSR